MAAKLVIFFFSVLIGCRAAASAAGNLFLRDFDITWGEGRTEFNNRGKVLSLSLDKDSGSAFQSKKKYMFGRFDIQMKLVPGNSAGTVTSFYLSSLGNAHDEIDFEFLGNLSGDPYILHTNVFSQGGGGREQQFYLWFDPTIDFHTYSIVWTPKQIMLCVDGIAIREFKNLESIGVPYPNNQSMRVYGSLWNADFWATRGGLVKTDWSKAPFIASYKNFNAIDWSSSSSSSSCGSNPIRRRGGDSGSDSDWEMEERVKWVKKKYMIYDYCQDLEKHSHGLPSECLLAAAPPPPPPPPPPTPARTRRQKMKNKHVVIGVV
ncbi:xyloglucan endotransglucosylase/hydrolase 2-like [Impatiens glandulifera]|uniref:xyloglucan endotransglucosylase/hydrolase 2-like n=1 Tax=Impatiens glandulifera TaxID=253017 RepID=UPI001FB187A5|nr:xyloglucan endotransglucosylase/hydrolase 2-like [Impatiens glandulifera]